MTYTRVFDLPDAGGRLRQGEILSDVLYPLVETPPNPDEAPKVVSNEFPFAVLVTPDCDIETYERNLASGNNLTMNGFMLLPMEPRKNVSNKQWTDAKNNSRAATHVIEGCNGKFDLQSTGFPQLYADFRWLFSVHPEYLKAILVRGDAKRRTQLLSPYRDHLQARLTAHIGRVALDRDHDTA